MTPWLIAIGGTLAVYLIYFLVVFIRVVVWLRRP